jgi:hypothetical protein
MAKNSETSKNRFENILAYMIAGVVGVSVLSILITLIALANGNNSLPAILYILPSIGLPFGFLLVITLLVTSLIRRKNEGK